MIACSSSWSATGGRSTTVESSCCARNPTSWVRLFERGWSRFATGTNCRLPLGLAPNSDVSFCFSDVVLSRRLSHSWCSPHRTSVALPGEVTHDWFWLISIVWWPIVVAPRPVQWNRQPREVELRIVHGERGVAGRRQYGDIRKLDDASVRLEIIGADDLDTCRAKACQGQRCETLQHAKCGNPQGRGGELVGCPIDINRSRVLHPSCAGQNGFRGNRR